eukprot:6492147-Amphidinium_carterae.6
MANLCLRPESGVWGKDQQRRMNQTYDVSLDLHQRSLHEVPPSTRADRDVVQGCAWLALNYLFEVLHIVANLQSCESSHQLYRSLVSLAFNLTCLQPELALLD